MSRELPVLPKRQCGDCTMCCTNLAVEELHKERDDKCQHEGKGRCNIYADRPQSCQDFECLWLQGIIPHHLKPNKTGIVVSTNTHQGGWAGPGEMLVCFVHPKDRYAWKRGPFHKWLVSLRRKAVKVLITCGKEQYFDGVWYGKTAKDFQVQIIDIVKKEPDAKQR